MKISEIIPGHHDATTRRRVGIRFDDRREAIQAAVRLYREFGLDPEIQDTAIWVETVQHVSGPLMGLMERATGVPGFNEWWDQP